jgi:magnesium-transporting ATPase (P-type)
VLLICTDKTGTLTENKMSLNPYTLLAATNYETMEYGRGKKVIEIAMWAASLYLLIRWKNATQGYQKTTTNDTQTIFHDS